MLTNRSFENATSTTEYPSNKPIEISSISSFNKLEQMTQPNNQINDWNICLRSYSLRHNYLWEWKIQQEVGSRYKNPLQTNRDILHIVHNASSTHSVTHQKQKASLKNKRLDFFGQLLQNKDLFEQTWQKEAERGNPKNLINHTLLELKV